MPLLAGFAAHKGYINIQAILLSNIIMTWSTTHIWFISTYYIEDYKKAKIPIASIFLKKYLTTTDKTYVRKAYKTLNLHIGTTLTLILLERILPP